MNNFVDVQGDLYNTFMEITSVSRVRYQKHSDNWCFVIYLRDNRQRNWSHEFDTQHEAELYREEFVYKVCNQ